MFFRLPFRGMIRKPTISSNVVREKRLDGTRKARELAETLLEESDGLSEAEVQQLCIDRVRETGDTYIPTGEVYLFLKVLRKRRRSG